MQFFDVARGILALSFFQPDTEVRGGATWLQLLLSLDLIFDQDSIRPRPGPDLSPVLRLRQRTRLVLIRKILTAETVSIVCPH